MSTKPSLTEAISKPSTTTTNASSNPPTPTTATKEGGSGTGSSELASAVDELLDQLQHKFDNVSTEIFGKLDDMTRRLDELEAALMVEEAVGAGGAGTKS